MPFHTESVLGGNLFEDLANVRIMKLRERPTLPTDQVIVLRVAVVVLVHIAAVLARHTAKHTRFHHLIERPINRRSADAVRPAIQLPGKLLGIEVVVLGEHRLDDRGPLPGHAFAARRQILPKLFGGRYGDVQGSEIGHVTGW